MRAVGWNSLSPSWCSSISRLPIATSSSRSSPTSTHTATLRIHGSGIKEREETYPTGLAFETVSVALPHVDPEHLNKPYIAVIKPKKPIAFRGMAGIDGDVPAQIIVNLGLTAHEEGQVAVLQALMGIFLDTDAVSRIMAQTTPEGMVETMRELCS